MGACQGWAFRWQVDGGGQAGAPCGQLYEDIIKLKWDGRLPRERVGERPGWSRGRARVGEEGGDWLLVGSWGPESEGLWAVTT